MKILIVAVITFLAVFYVFTFRKWRKRKKNNIDTVADFRNKYFDDDIQSNDINEQNKSLKNKNSIDYIDKEEFLKSCK